MLYFAILLTLIFSFLLVLIFEDKRIGRRGQLIILAIATVLIGFEWSYDFMSIANKTVNSLFDFMHWYGYPLTYLMLLGIIYALFSLRPAWNDEVADPSENIVGKILLKRYTKISVLIVALGLGIFMDVKEWHIDSLKSVQANLNAIEIEKAVATAKEQFREEIRKEEIQKFLTNLQNGPKTRCTKQVYLKTTEPGQEIKIFASGCGMINQLRVFRGKPTQVIANVPEQFYVQVQMNGIDSNLYGYSVQRGPTPIIKATWPKGESLPMPQLVF